jgi:hypothetical protein
MLAVVLHVSKAGMLNRNAGAWCYLLDGAGEVKEERTRVCLGQTVDLDFIREVPLSLKVEVEGPRDCQLRICVAALRGYLDWMVSGGVIRLGRPFNYHRKIGGLAQWSMLLRFHACNRMVALRTPHAIVWG